MSVPFKKTVFLVDAMAFRRARAESFLNPWARNESVELISLDPDEAHTKLVERAACDMLIYSVGAPSPHEIFTAIQVLHTLRRDAALAIVSDDFLSHSRFLAFDLNQSKLFCTIKMLSDLFHSNPEGSEAVYR